MCIMLLASFSPDISTPYRHAVRYNWMVNPLGKEGHWRGADWVEESNNMFAKVRCQRKWYAATR